eukprot:TRINITY_DN70471_c0_g1_i1.p1 TRINITY_DN70471_c0_g1~~TRINITY_DN70471_c0_g1_i1.p1  ORF type:complete len:488 (-),score=111.94 TRINITY_DN70471_c0_g1_i1:38-1501(-)
MASAANLTAKNDGALVEGLFEDARKPFGQLLKETPNALCILVEHCDAVGSTMESQGSADPTAAVTFQKPLPAGPRDSLICRILVCCDAVVKELSTQEVDLWNAFVGADASLRGVLRVCDANLTDVVRGFTSCDEIVGESVIFLKERANDEGEVDFADLLEWFKQLRKVDQNLQWKASLRAGFEQLMRYARSESPTTPSLRAERVTELKERCRKAEGIRLAEAGVAYQRLLVLTSCWCCEQHLRSMLAPIDVGNAESDGEVPCNSSASPGGVTGADGGAGLPRLSLGGARASLPGPVAALLGVLRGIHADLAPAERVLWELLGCQDRNFDGAFSTEEVTAAIAQLSCHAPGRDSAKSEEEFEELQRLRGACRDQSLVGLLSTENVRRRGVVSLAVFLRWWWDMPEAYRVAAGLSVPLALLRKTVAKQPEELFKSHLRRVAADVASAKISLRGYVRVFAELRALCVRRAVEGLQVGPPSDAEEENGKKD